MLRSDKKAAGFSADQRLEPNRLPPDLVHEGLRSREPLLGDLLAFVVEELLREEWMGHQRRPVPDVEHVGQVRGGIWANHRQDRSRAWAPSVDN